MALPVTITGISTAVAPVGPFKVAAGTTSVTKKDQTTASFTNNAASVSSWTNVIAGQTFTSSSSYGLTDIGIMFADSGSTANVYSNAYMEVRSGSVTGTVLGTSDLKTITVDPLAAIEVLFHFSTPVSLTASSVYAYVVYIPNPAAALGLRFYGNASSDYAGGAAYSPANSTNPSSLTIRATAPFDYAANFYATNTVASDSYYFFGRDGTTATTLQAFKSTAPDTSWASVTTKTGFTTALLNIAAYQVDNVIHMAVLDGTMPSSVATKYLSFDAATDTFLATTETVGAAAAIGGQVAGVGAGCSIVVRSSGNAVIFYNGLQTNTSGTPRARLYYRERTGLNTYGTATRVDANTAIDNVGPEALMGATNSVHFNWCSSTTFSQRTLSAANALQAASTPVSYGIAFVVQGVSYDRSGVIKVVTGARI